MQQTYFAVHGVGASGSMVTVDGLVTNGIMGDGAVMAYHNEAMIQEAVYQTAGGTAETITGGINMNLVPKDGGNRFAGALKYGEVAEAVAGRQPDDPAPGARRERGRQDRQLLRVQHREGGPIVKDKLWFFGAFRTRALRQADREHVQRPGGRGVGPGGLRAVSGDDRLVRAGHLGREDGQPGRPHDVADVAAQQVRGLHGSRDAAARPRDGQPHRSGDRRRWCGTRRPSPPARRSGRRRCRRSCWSRPASRSTASATTTSIRTGSTSRTARPRGTPARARATTARGCCGTRRARSSATIPDKYNVMAAISYVTGSHNVKVGLPGRLGTVQALEHGERAISIRSTTAARRCR